MNYQKLSLIVFSWIILLGCNSKQNNEIESPTIEPLSTEFDLNLESANKLAQLPLKCIQTRLPYKPGITVTGVEDLQMPYFEHPAFYGCFDWHSAVHGHWSLVYLMKTFPELASKEAAIEMLNQNLTQENIEKEIAYFKKNKYTKSFERTYGWAWVLKLHEELLSWENEHAVKWAKNLQPLSQYISSAYQEYLPKLVYPIRVGEHSNTAFGLSFAYGYAKSVNDENLISIIEKSALRFYSNDKGCPITWEPSGYDFLSPCLQEIDIMRKILDDVAFEDWLSDFLPNLKNEKLTMKPGEVIDRTDGKLVHLDGVNFSRAWCLYPLSKNNNARKLADEHLAYSIGSIADGNYAGEHWLASFALYAYKTRALNK